MGNTVFVSATFCVLSAGGIFCVGKGLCLQPNTSITVKQRRGFIYLAGVFPLKYDAYFVYFARFGMEAAAGNNLPVILTFH
jgi:hypothetical protein